MENFTAHILRQRNLANIAWPNYNPYYAPNFRSAFVEPLLQTRTLLSGGACAYSFRFVPSGMAGGSSKFPAEQIGHPAKCAPVSDAASHYKELAQLLGPQFLGQGIREHDSGCATAESEFNHGLLLSSGDRAGYFRGFSDCSWGSELQIISQSTAWKLTDMNVQGFQLAHYCECSPSLCVFFRRPHRCGCTDAATGLNTAIGTELTHGSYPVHYSFMRGAGRQYGVPWWSSVAEFVR